jgi:hypothetical protein
VRVVRDPSRLVPPMIKHERQVGEFYVVVRLYLTRAAGGLVRLGGLRGRGPMEAASGGVHGEVSALVVVDPADRHAVR